MKFTTALISAAFVATTLVGCGGSSDYCDSLESANGALGNVTTQDGKDVEKAFDQVHSLAEEAPSEVEDDWKVVDAAVVNLRKSFEEAGLSFDDLGKTGADAPKPPDAAAQKKLQAAAQELASEKVVKANENITKHAKSECDIDLKGTGA